MMLIGRVAYTNPTYGFALITPAGKSRDHDVFCLERWFLAGGLGEPHVGMLAAFEIGRTSDGDLEAMFVRHPPLQPPEGMEARSAGAAPVTGSPITVTGNFSGAS